MTFRLTMTTKPVSPTLERFLTRAAAERGRKWWERATGLRLRVKGER